jgi:hypothetical protein
MSHHAEDNAHEPAQDEIESLQRRLLADGQAWRSPPPDTKRLLQLMRSLEITSPETGDTLMPEKSHPGTPSTAIINRRPNIAIAAASVTILIALAVAGFVWLRPAHTTNQPGANGHPTATASATATATNPFSITLLKAAASATRTTIIVKTDPFNDLGDYHPNLTDADGNIYQPHVYGPAPGPDPYPTPPPATSDVQIEFDPFPLAKLSHPQQMQLKITPLDYKSTEGTWMLNFTITPTPPTRVIPLNLTQTVNGASVKISDVIVDADPHAVDTNPGGILLQVVLPNNVACGAIQDNMTFPADVPVPPPPPEVPLQFADGTHIGFPWLVEDNCSLSSWSPTLENPTPVIYLTAHKLSGEVTFSIPRFHKQSASGYINGPWTFTFSLG